jgi:hypothetical protein
MKGSEVNSYNIVLLGYTVKEAVTIPPLFKGTATKL